MTYIFPENQLEKVFIFQKKRKLCPKDTLLHKVPLCFRSHCSLPGFTEKEKDYCEFYNQEAWGIEVCSKPHRLSAVDMKQAPGPLFGETTHLESEVPTNRKNQDSKHLSSKKQKTS